MRLLCVLAFGGLMACGAPAVNKGGGGGGGTSAKVATNGAVDDGSVDEEDHGPVLARVGDVVVYLDEYEALLRRETPSGDDAFTPEDKKRVLDELINQKMLYLEAKKKDVDRDPKVQKLMVQTLMRNEVYAKVRNNQFTPEELRDYFEQHRDEFVVPEKVQVKRIFVRVGEDLPEAEAKKLADDLHAQLVNDISKFGDLAREHSKDPYRKRGGDMGFVSRQGKPGVDPEVIDKAFSLGVDALSPVFKTGNGYNIITVAGKREKMERTFEQMKGSVLRKRKNERYRELYDEYVSDVAGKYEVEVFTAELDKVEIEPRGPGPSRAGRPGRVLRPGGDEDEAPENGGEEGEDEE